MQNAVADLRQLTAEGQMVSEFLAAMEQIGAKSAQRSLNGIVLGPAPAAVIVFRAAVNPSVEAAAQSIEVGLLF